MTLVYWDEFTWEAFATLATGFAAVVAAIYVGSRQAAISKVQAEILAKQIEQKGLELRIATFDRRWEFLEEFRRAIVAREDELRAVDISNLSEAAKSEALPIIWELENKAAVLFSLAINAKLLEIKNSLTKAALIRAQTDKPIRGDAVSSKAALERFKEWEDQRRITEVLYVEFRDLVRAEMSLVSPAPGRS